MIDDRRAVRAADGPEVADRERAAAEFVEGELRPPGPAGPTTANAWASWAILSRSASRITGTTSPRGVSTATPRFTYSL